MSPVNLHANLAMGLPVPFIGPSGCNVEEAIERFGCGVSLCASETNQTSWLVREGLANAPNSQEHPARARDCFRSEVLRRSRAAQCWTASNPQFRGDSVRQPAQRLAELACHVLGHSNIVRETEIGGNLGFDTL